MLSANSCIRLQFAYGVSNTIFSLVSGGQYLIQVEEELFILSFYINFKLQNFGSYRNTTDSHIITDIAKILLNMFYIYIYIYIQWNLSNPKHQGTSEMCRIGQDVGILRFYF
jgi:hypothetical protein